jgi:hypothetical protein
MGKRYGFTGSRYVAPEHHSFIDLVLENYLDGSEYTTGAQAGIDTFVLRRLAPKLSEAHHRVIVPSAPHLERYLAMADEVIYLPPSREPYRDRNEKILEYTDVLIALPLHPEEEQPRSGTWMTIRMAKKAGIPVEIAMLDKR